MATPDGSNPDLRPGSPGALKYREIPTRDGGRVCTFEAVDRYTADLYASGVVAPIHGFQKRSIVPDAIAALNIGDTLALLERRPRWIAVDADGQVVAELTGVGSDAVSALHSPSLLIAKVRLSASGVVLDAGGFAAAEPELGRLRSMLRP